jgi:hypothetical protein
MKPRAVRSDRGLQDHDRYTNRTIREWARDAGVKVADKGVISKAVRTAWIDAHQGLNNPVLWHNLTQVKAGEPWRRTVEVLCYRCAGIHSHGGFPGQRPAPEHNHRVSHCSGEYAGQEGGYYIEDTLPVDENENAMAEVNSALEPKT